MGNRQPGGARRLSRRDGAADRLNPSRHPSESWGLMPQSAPRRERCQHPRSEEHTSELQSLMRISYAVFCLKKKKKTQQNHRHIKSNTKCTTNSNHHLISHSTMTK